MHKVELKSLYFRLVYVFLLSSKTRIYMNKIHIYCLTGDKSNSPVEKTSPFQGSTCSPHQAAPVQQDVDQCPWVQWRH